MMTDDEYRKSQLGRVTADYAKIKLVSDGGDTKFLDLSPAELDAIKAILAPEATAEQLAAYDGAHASSRARWGAR